MLKIWKYIDRDVCPQTSFKFMMGKIIPWAAAILFFYGSLELKGRQPFDLTFERLAHLLQIDTPQLVNDVQKIIEMLKEQYQKPQTGDYANIDQIIYQTSAKLDGGLPLNIIIRRCAQWIGKQMETEYKELTFKKDP